MTEPRDHRIKRLAMRAMRRGIKEMDLILPPFAATHLPGADDAALDLFEAFLAENDHDLYNWISGITPPPDAYAALVAQIAQGAVGVVRPA
ncbi:MAG: succinate dehydrogenase assembly factor 2 [Rhodobacterales bacterium]|nr:succinate dehydrogenase assembly factor 2 [Rhodobacterales bacterium]NCT12713.1 succinate dehydrogenase assembly factor 2 [Rhodobacterales bacterium]